MVRGMGGEPWKTRAPFHPDIAHVLDETRHRVFRDGWYYQERPFATLEELDEFFLRDPREDEEWTGEGATGTQSILDIRGVSSRIASGVAAPLADEKLRDLFGTTTPTSEQLTEERESELYEMLPTRGECLYVVVYEGGKPSEVVFYGYSWD
jgi:hypothetical protein